MTPFFIVFGLVHLLGFLSSIQAIFETRTPQGTIAWFFALNTLPIIAVPLYWILGRSKFRGYKLVRSRAFRANDPTAREALEELQRANLIAGPDRRDPALLERLARLPFTVGNDAELLVDGTATFDSIFQGMAQARDYLLVQFYIFRDDGLGQRMQAALMAAAARGVRVYVLFDEIGSRSLPRAYCETLRAAGVDIRAFDTQRGGRANRLQIIFRNHRKILIADGRAAWIGGFNVGDEYLGGDPRYGAWRDTHVKLTGPAVLGAQIAFFEDWFWASGARLELSWRPHVAPDPSMIALCLPSGPADPVETCTLFFASAIQSARHRLWLATPYFVPDEPCRIALQLAALRGVDVRILLPEKVDNRLVQLSSYAYLEELEQVGIRFWRYTGGLLHQKVLLIDDVSTAIGTANFDNRSFRLNFEVTVVTVDVPFANRVEAMLVEDFRRSRPLLAKEFREKPFPFRLAVRAARLMAPVQ